MVKVMCVVKGLGHVWPSNFKGQDYGQGQTHWSHLRPGVQSICLLFVSWQSDHFWLRYRKFHIWPWKFKVKVMTKVKPDGHIWGLGVQSIGEGGARWTPPRRDGLSCFTINDKWSLDLLSSFGGRFRLPVICKAVAVISRLLRMIHWFEKIYTSWSNFTASWKCHLLRMHTYNYSVIGCLNWTAVEVLKNNMNPCLVVYIKEGAVWI